MGDVAASGKKVSTSGIGIYRIVGGKVAEGRLEWDRASLQEQIGSAKPAVSALEPA